MDTEFRLTIDYMQFIEKVKANRGKYIKVDDGSYYHGNLNAFQILQEQKGILSMKKRGLEHPYAVTGGNHYISPTKKSNSSYAYKFFIKNGGWDHDGFSFIIDKNIKAIKTIKAEVNFFFSFVNKTRIPIRFSRYSDEYHIRDEIKPESFTAIQYYLLEHLDYHLSRSFRPETKIITMLCEIRKMIDLMEKLQIDIPFIDGTDSTEINKDIFKQFLLEKAPNKDLQTHAI